MSVNTLAMCEILDRLGSSDPFSAMSLLELKFSGPQTTEWVALEESLRNVVRRFLELEQKLIEQKSEATAIQIDQNIGAQLGTIQLTPPEEAPQVEIVGPHVPPIRAHKNESLDSHIHVSSSSNLVHWSDSSPDYFALASRNAILTEEISNQDTHRIRIQEEVQHLKDDLRETRRVMEEYHRVLKDIRVVTEAAARGDLSKTLTVTEQGEIGKSKRTVNNMVGKLRHFASEVTRATREIGTMGKLGRQAKIDGVEGTWKELIDTINNMADQLTRQTRNVVNVTTAVADGDMSQEIPVEAQGEIRELAETINNMIRRLNNFGNEVCRVAREVGIEGRLGGQADIRDVQGLWKETTSNVNDMANNLTAQVRAFADITMAASERDLGYVPKASKAGNLKQQINDMVTSLNESIRSNNLAREAADSASANKSEFLAKMSHELRTPMNGVIGLLRLTLEETDGQLNRSQKENLQTDLANSLMLILDDLLDISKIEAGRMDIENTNFSLRSALYLALKTVSVKATQKGLSLILILDPALPDQVIGDECRLRQVINNLLSNAVKFTDEGEVVVSLNLEGQDKNMFFVKVTVLDTGIGIEKDKINIIFDKFRQGNESITRRFGGTGLGLSISKQLVLLMGGTLEASSTFGEGSVFKFDLPLARVHTQYDEVLDVMEPFRGRYILYLDSQYDNTGVAEMMRGLGLRVFVAHTLAHAFKTSDEQSIDTVVLDAVDHVRPVRAHVRLSGVAIILLTTSGTIKDLNEGLAEPGISCIYTTPTSPVDLYPPLMAALLSDQAAHWEVIPFDILLAEDNRINRNIAVKLLKGHHNVDAVENGQEAFNAFVGNKYDVILMDVQMPVLGGFEATALIRKYEAEHGLKPTPIIALTAHAMIGYRQKCLEAGMTDYLTKPIDKTLLLTMIRKCASSAPVVVALATQVIEIPDSTEESAG